MGPAPEFSKVTQVYATGFSCNYHWTGGWYEPIPLTPEVLEKCGFHKQNNAWVPEGHESKGYTTWDFTIWDGGRGEYYYNSAEFPTPLQFLHQLQNLYFALTGEELTYTP